jgi:phosphoglycerol transferase
VASSSANKQTTGFQVDWHEVTAYAIVAVIALMLGVLGLQAWKADLRVPFNYSSDAMLNGVLVKGSIDHGWIQSNPTIGLPGQLDLADFPFGETLDFGIMKVISIFARDWALSMNLFFLLTFPLTAVLAMWTMRRLKISRWPAGITSLIYTILPYHFLRGEGHLGLAAYFLVPPMILVVLWSMADEPLLFSGHGSKKWKLDLKRPEPIIAIVICVLAAFGGVYYAFFACAFLFVGGGIAAMRNGKWQLLVSAMLLIGVIVVAGLVNLSPGIVYHLQHGSNAAASVRNPGQAEIYALKIDQLFLPVDGHRIGKFAAIKALYHQGMAQLSRWLDNEAVVTNPLGLVGVLGFLIALLAPFLGAPANRWLGKQRFELIQRLGQLTIAGLLLGTVGGFGAIVAFVLPQIRSYNRIVVFLAFFGMAALALVLDRMLSHAKNPTRRIVVIAAMVALAAFAYFDTVPPSFAPDYAALAAAYRGDAAFVAQVQAALPKDAAVFQLPYMPFPEPGGPLVKMTDYEPLRGYLHSSTLRWSYGAQKGREADAWQRQVAAMPAAIMVGELKAAGFSAVWVDRNGYEDNGAAIEAELARITGSTPIVSPDGQLVVFALK